MAERRMFAKSIIGSARFLRMPPTSRLLYYDLGMYADDDGVVEAFSVMRQTGSTEDDLRVLVAKGFVTVLNEDLVSLITDWNTNNFIRSDRYHPSIYKDLVLRLTDGIPTDNQRYTEDSIGKDSLGKDSLDNNVLANEETTALAIPKKSALKEEFETLWALYPRKQGKDKAYKYYEKARKSGTTYEEVECGIYAYIRYIQAEQTEQQYIKMGSTFFSQKAWEDDWTVVLKPKSSGNPFDDLHRRMTGKGVFDDFR